MLTSTAKQNLRKQTKKSFFKESAPRLEIRLKEALKEKKGIKWSLVYHCEMSMPDKYQSEPMLYSLHFQLEHLMTSTYLEELPEQIDASMEVLEERMSLFAKAGSGWTLHQNHALILEMDAQEPLQGEALILNFPKDIHDSKAVVNIKNEDLECFKWSILAALHPASKDAQRVTKYQEYKDELNFEGINFSMTIDKISKFEKQHPGISVTVIGIAKDKK